MTIIIIAVDRFRDCWEAAKTSATTSTTDTFVVVSLKDTLMAITSRTEEGLREEEEGSTKSWCGEREELRRFSVCDGGDNNTDTDVLSIRVEAFHAVVAVVVEKLSLRLDVVNPPSARSK